jgi:hypothetical protein
VTIGAAGFGGAGFGASGGGGGGGAGAFFLQPDANTANAIARQMTEIFRLLNMNYAS